MTDFSNLFTELDRAGIQYEANVPMSNYTSFKIGGPADVLIEANNSEDIAKAVNLCRGLGVNAVVIGKGSNLLVSDDGITGAVIVCSSKSSALVVDNVIVAEAGTSLMALCIEAKKHSLSGLEFAYGIPASVGGAVYMNAGAYGGSISDVLISVDCLMPNGEIKTIHKDEFDYGYRKSCFMNNGAIILKAKFELSHKCADEIDAAMSDLITRRRAKQPLEYPSAGSVFKRPEGYFAGALIEQCGLKGYRIGGAEVSSKHAGFIVNRGGATCNDVMKLVEYIKATVLDKFGVELETEIKKIGR